MIKIIRICAFILGLLVGYQGSREMMPLLLPMVGLQPTAELVTAGSVVGAIIIGLILYFITPAFIQRFKVIVESVESQFQKISLHEFLISLLGVAAGLIIANLLTFALLLIPFVGRYLPIFANIFLGYLGFRLASKKRDELSQLRSSKGKATTSNSESNIKILDTSVIIDGRIADICPTGFLEGVLGIPNFVLKELRHIADSADSLRRNRGRRGLDILNRIQTEMSAQVQIIDKDFEDITEVDGKLVRLAQLLGGSVVTNDYNLNKVCQLQGVPVLNINELANALKPVALPGEEMRVVIVKEGKEHGQGVAYLDDGTMIVVEDGKEHLNNNVAVVVTSVLQTAAGRMIFAKKKGQ